MEKKSWPWLSYVNLIALITIILICLGLIYFLSNGMLLGFLLAEFKPYFLVFTALLLIGFYILFMMNYAKAQGKSGWLFLIATIIFIPIAICLIGLALALLHVK